MQREGDYGNNTSEANVNFRVTSGTRLIYFAPFALRPYGLAVRTPPFHGGSPGSIPGRVAILNTSISHCKNKRNQSFALAGKKQ